MKNLKILLVDDFEMIRIMMRNTLSDLGYTNIIEADNGVNALNMIKHAQTMGVPVGLVFCDWNMPELTGIEVLEKMRKTSSMAKIPFVMVTAESEHESVVRALSAGADDYVVKPIEPEVLQRKLERIINRSTKAA